ncbi:MAG TPA: hypothetical protein VMH39_08370 [Gemmatimonadaceae bacterium]|nr:hypothetical protein [Gemmatimonadaceae bacterium]
MRDTLVQAKVGLADLRAALAAARERLVREQRELDTMRRRKGLATGIGDAETAALAEQYEKIHSDRVAVLARKVAAQTDELALAERDVEAMSTELKLAVSGIDPAAASRAGAATADSTAQADAAAEPGGPLADELDALDRSRARATREAEADRKLEELKRRMGK